MKPFNLSFQETFVMVAYFTVAIWLILSPYRGYFPVWPETLRINGHKPEIYLPSGFFNKKLVWSSPVLKYSDNLNWHSFVVRWKSLSKCISFHTLSVLILARWELISTIGILMNAFCSSLHIHTRRSICVCASLSRHQLVFYFKFSPAHNEACVFVCWSISRGASLRVGTAHFHKIYYPLPGFRRTRQYRAEQRLRHTLITKLN